MITAHTPETLKAFEADIADHFNAGVIRAPVHLSGGNEEALIEIFKAVKPQDWVLTTWRSHYHCLLKGVPPAQLRNDIMAGKSITLTYPEHRIMSSAIVAGICPIAVGLGLSINRSDKRERQTALADAPPEWEQPSLPPPWVPRTVWCFVGDMAAETGGFSECAKYAAGHDLPVRFVIEDNGLSVCTDTQKSWGGLGRGREFGRVTRYGYKLPWPHSGAGRRINF